MSGVVWCVVTLRTGLFDFVTLQLLGPQHQYQQQQQRERGNEEEESRDSRDVVTPPRGGGVCWAGGGTGWQTEEVEVAAGRTIE